MINSNLVGVISAPHAAISRRHSSDVYYIHLTTNLKLVQSMRKSSAVVWFNSDKTIDTKEDVVDSTSVSKDQYKHTHNTCAPLAHRV